MLGIKDGPETPNLSSENLQVFRDIHVFIKVTNYIQFKNKFQYFWLEVQLSGSTRNFMSF